MRREWVNREKKWEELAERELKLVKLEEEMGERENEIRRWEAAVRGEEQAMTERETHIRRDARREFEVSNC